MKLLSENKIFGGRQLRYSHRSTSCHCDMTFSIFLPPQAALRQVPVLYWLSGLTCTDENFVQKSGAQRYAAEHGIAIVCPDTSPRGDNVADDAEGGWDFGLGAGFYVNATQEPWSRHYNMYDYIVDELPALIAQELPQILDRKSISGHSMGGHGALTIALKNPGDYCSVSAFAPIVAPSGCPWGEKALAGYLGDDKNAWQKYDSCALIEYIHCNANIQIPLLVDQGGADNFLSQQLQPEKIQLACEQTGHPLDYRYREGYDHSYYYIASFIEEHICYHAEHLFSY